MGATTNPLSPRGPARTAGVGRRRKSRRARRVIAAVIAVGAVGMALAAQAPAARASATLTTPAPDVGIIPFTGDVYTVDSSGNLIPVTFAPSPTPLSAPLTTWLETRSTSPGVSSHRLRRRRTPGPTL
jgi:hypothetical protein